MKTLRQHRQLALLPAIIWLAVQLVMAVGFTAASPAAAKAPASLAPLIGNLEAEHWLCGPSDTAGSHQGAPTQAAAHGCFWCQGFGAMPELAEPPASTPDLTSPGLANLPFASEAPPTASARLSGFRSRAPPPLIPASMTVG